MEKREVACYLIRVKNQILFSGRYLYESICNGQARNVKKLLAWLKEIMKLDA